MLLESKAHLPEKLEVLGHAEANPYPSAQSLLGPACWLVWDMWKSLYSQGRANDTCKKRWKTLNITPQLPFYTVCIDRCFMTR